MQIIVNKQFETIEDKRFSSGATLQDGALGGQVHDAEFNKDHHGGTVGVRPARFFCSSIKCCGSESCLKPEYFKQTKNWIFSLKNFKYRYLLKNINFQKILTEPSKI